MLEKLKVLKAGKNEPKRRTNHIYKVIHKKKESSTTWNTYKYDDDSRLQVWKYVIKALF